MLTNLGAGLADQQVVTLGDANGLIAPFDPDGTLEVSNDPTTLLFDTMDSTLANWTTGGTVAPTLSAGSTVFAPSTTASASSYMRTTANFMLQSQAYLRVSNMLKIETAAVVNSTRFWGYGTIQGTPTAAAPVLNGAVFLLDYVAGALYAATYSAGTRTNAIALTRPADGAVHKYEIWYRQSVSYFIIDGITVATITMPNLVVTNNEYLIAGAINFTTAPSVAPLFQLTSASVSDTGRNNLTLSDAINPATRATIKASSGTAPVTTDTALVVQAYIPGSSLSTTLGAVATAVTLTLAAPTAGLSHYVTGMWLERYVSTATTAAASAFVTTATNSNIVFNLPSDAQAIGTVGLAIAINFTSPIKSLAPATATSFTVPAIAGTQYRISISYYIAP